MNNYHDSEHNSEYDFEQMKNFFIGDGEETEPCISDFPFIHEELTEIPYYKRPLLQFAVVFGIGISVIFLTLLAFKSESSAIAQATPAQLDQEKANLISALKQEQEKTRQLELQNALLNQQELDVTIPNSKTLEPKPKPKPKPPATLPPQTVTPRKKVQTTYTPPSVRRSVPNRSPVVQTQPVVRPIPLPDPTPDPMSEWLAIANQGHYTTAHITEKSNSRLVSQEIPAIDQPSHKSDYPLLNDSQISDALDNTALLSDSELLARINGRTSTRVVTQRPKTVNRSTNNIIDIGSFAQATLESAVVWSTDTRGQFNKKYLLRLKEEFKNVDGKVILPVDTRLIAQVANYDNSGLLAMEVIQILHQGRKIDVTPGALAIEGKKGSPLKADLKQKGDSDFWANVGSVVAPGVERALDSASDTLVVQNGSVFRSDSRRNPLTSGVSGIADGVSQTLNRRLERNQRETIVSYFQLDSGKTVYLRAYEDISF